MPIETSGSVTRFRIEPLSKISDGPIGGGSPTPSAEINLQIFNPDITGFNAQTIQEARENRVLTGKVILILGVGPNGMGGAAAKEAALQGATVVVSSRANENGGPRNPAMSGFVNQLSSLGVMAEWRGSDVAQVNRFTDEKDREVEEFDSKRVIREVVNDHGKIDGLIVTSGDIQSTPLFQRIDFHRFDEIQEQDARGPAFAMLAAAEQMMRQKPAEGRIAVVGSIAGVGNALQFEYSMAKASLHAGAISLGKELDMGRLRAIEKGRVPAEVFVNALAPGVVTTPPIERDYTLEQRTAIVKASGAERELVPAEPGIMLAFLMGPYAEGINGQVIPMLGRGKVPSWISS